MGSSSADSTFAFSVKTDSWDHYAQYRPSYPASMWSAWLDYHRGPLTSIMDVGTGGGVGAAGLLAVAHAKGHLAQIKHVYLSDPNDDNLAAAKKNFTAARFPGIAFHFHRGPAEDPFPGLAPRSVDMLISCASIHWMDIDAAMATFAAALRAGGTFGAVVYPQPTVRDEEVAAKLGEVFEQRRRFQDAGDAANVMSSIRARCYRNLSVGLDYVPFAADKWTDVRRRTANLPKDGKWPLRDSSWRHYGEPKVAVREGEEEVELVEEDEEYVRRGYTVEQLKEFFQTLGYESFVMDGRLWATEAFAEFEKVVKERGGKFDLVWPVATTLARAK